MHFHCWLFGLQNFSSLQPTLNLWTPKYFAPQTLNCTNFHLCITITCCANNHLLFLQNIQSGSYIAITLSVCSSVHTFITDISASTGRNDSIFDIWLWNGDLYRVSPFQVCRTSTSCLQCDLEFFMFAVMKTFVTVISASTGRNDFIFDICLLCDLQMNQWGYSQHDVACNILFHFFSSNFQKGYLDQETSYIVFILLTKYYSYVMYLMSDVIFEDETCYREIDMIA